MEKDIVEELRKWGGTKVGESPPSLPNQWSPALSDLLNAAAAEIERLRALAGAVTAGPSLREIRDSKTTGC